jgi:hypothetical protein
MLNTSLTSDTAFSATTTTGKIVLTYLDENNIIQTFSASASTSASATENNTSENLSINLLNDSLDSFKDMFKNIVKSDKTITSDSNTFPDNEYVTLYYFAYPYIINTIFINRTKLLPENPEYLKLNEFNYSTNVSSVIISPNFNVLYFPAILDLTYLHNTNKKIKLTLPPNIKDLKKYYILQFIDLFTNNFFYINSQTNTEFITEWEIVAPDYKGPINKNTVVSNSWYLIILGRIETDFRVEGDLDYTISLEKQFVIEAEKIDPQTIDLPDVSKLVIDSKEIDINRYYNSFLKALQWQTFFNTEDKIVLELFKTLGIFKNDFPFTKPTIPFEPTTSIVTYKEAAIKGINYIDLILSQGTGTLGNYWGTSADSINKEGIPRYILYALIAKQYTYGNNPTQAIYLSNFKDENGIQLNGSNNYILDVDKTPQINSPGFWSITAYRPDGYIEQQGQLYFTVGQGITEPCKITFSSAPSPDPQSNIYLQVPTGDFYVLLRIYNPVEETTFIPNYIVKQ